MQATGTEAFTRPRFRHDHLLAEALEDGGSKFVDVMDPDTGSMFRFYEIEFSIACGMDGQRDVPQLIAWAKDELGLLPTAVEVRNVIAQLGQLGYLDLGAIAQAAAAAPVESVPISTSRPSDLKKPAAAKVDDELAPGIVVGAQQRESLPPAPDVELGHAGPMDRGAPAIADSMPVEEFALGAPGVQDAPKAAKLPVEDVALGAPGRVTPVAQPDVSLDLSDHMAVGRDELKEAVRASKVMSAVDVPKDLLVALEEPAPEPVKPAKPIAKPEPVIAKPVEKPQPKPEPAVTKPAEKQPIVAKQPPKQVEKPAEKHPVAPAPASRVTTRLIILFVVLLAVFGVYMVWKHVLKKSNSDATQTGTTQQPIVPKPEPSIKNPAEPPKPDPIKLSATTPSVRDVTAPAAGAVEQVETAKTVKKGQVVIWLTGGRNAQRLVDAAKVPYDKAVQDLDKAKLELDAARATASLKLPDFEKKYADLEKKVGPKKEALDKAIETLDKYSLRAAADGEVTVTAKPGKIAEGDVLFSLAPAAVLAATFKETKPDVVVDSPVHVAVKGSEKKVTCRATQVGDKSTVVECPLDPTLEGAEVTLVGLAPAEAPKPEAPKPETPEAPKPEQAKPEQPKPPAPRPRPPQPKPPEPKPEPPKPETPETPATPPPTPPDPPGTNP